MTDGLDWARATTIDELEEGFPEGVELEGRRLALFRIGNTVYATDDQCPHEQACLSDGYLEGEVVECPLHPIALPHPDGRSPSALLPRRDLTTYPVKIEDGTVLVGFKRD